MLFLNRVVKKGLTKVALDQKPEKGEGVNHVDNWEKNLPGRVRSKQKSSEVEWCIQRIGEIPLGLE